MSDTLTELRGRIDERRKTLAKAFEEAGPELDMSKVTVIEGADTKAKTEGFQKLDAELNDLMKAIEEHPETKLAGVKSTLERLNELNPHPGHQPDPGDDTTKGGRRGTAGELDAVKSLGTLFAESAGVKAWKDGGMHQGASFEAEDVFFTGGAKATFTAAGSNLAPLSIEDLPGIQRYANQQPLKIADLLSQGVTTRETVRYVIESSFTNAATVVAEGSPKPEASYATDVVSDNVTKIAVLSRVTDETFADFPMLRDYIDSRMRFMLGQTEESELVTGSGSGAHLTGLLNRAGLQTQAKGSDPTPDSIFKAMVKIQTGPFLQPDGVVMHPLDWQDIALLRTSDGLYVWGAPNGDVANPRIWGLPVCVTTAITQNTGLVGAFKLGAQIWRRQGITVDATNSNEDDFKKNLIMLRAEERLALAVYYPTAFCQVTGI